MTPLTGREASICARLAQTPMPMCAEDKQRILGRLEGRALRIARVLVGDSKRPSKKVATAALGFQIWARSLAGSI